MVDSGAVASAGASAAAGVVGGGIGMKRQIVGDPIIISTFEISFDSTR